MSLKDNELPETLFQLTERVKCHFVVVAYQNKELLCLRRALTDQKARKIYTTSSLVGMYLL